MGIVLALGAAVAYGLSDFIGGLASRRTTPWPVAFLASAGGAAGATLIALAAGGHAAAADLAWGALAGLGSGAGGAFLYRGLSRGRMGVVAPLSALGAALLPIAVGALLGDRPSAAAWLGIGCALPGIWLVARSPDPEPTDGPRASAAAGVTDGILAGLGFGLLFVALGQVSADAGFWPLVVTQAVGAVTVAAMATTAGLRWRPSVPADWWGLPVGLTAAAAQLLFTLATRTDLLTIAAVVTSLYPAGTVLLASLVLRETVHRAQLVGLALCLTAVALIAAG